MNLTLRTCTLVGTAIVALTVSATASAGAPQPSGISPDLVPLPCNQASGTASATTPGSPTWTIGIPLLLFADAMASCAQTTPVSVFDGFTENIVYAMASSESQAGYTLSLSYTPLEVFKTWLVVRRNSAVQCDQTTHLPAGAGVYLPAYSQLTPVFSQPISASVATDAIEDLTDPEFNLCVAQVMRQTTPGAASGQSLLFSDADQRLQLEIARERAQIAMLKFAVLTIPFVEQPPDNTNTALWQSLTEYSRMPVLSAWANDSSNAATVAKMGHDFAAAVQLHAAVTVELENLFARSRSARATRSSVSIPPVDDTWGYSSWYQRDYALLLGGDPLASPNLKTQPAGAWLSPDSVPGPLIGNDWPTWSAASYPRHSISSPKTQELFQLAKQFDDVNLVPTSQPSSACAQFDVAASATNIFENVEYDLDNHCATAPLHKCPAPRSLPSIPPSGDLSAWTLWNNYGITVDNATELAAYLVDALQGAQVVEGQQLQNSPALACDESGRTLGSLAVAGTDANGGPTYDGNGHLSPQAILTARTPVLLAQAYTDNAPIHFGNPVTATPLTDPTTLGFGGHCVAGPCNYYTDDAMRTMGATGAQAATRALVYEGLSAAQQNNQLFSTVAVSSFLALGTALMDAITGNIGTSVALAPEYGNLNNNISSVTWDIDVVAAANDPLWSMWPKYANGSTPYTVYCSPDSDAPDLATHPESSIGTKTIATIVAAPKSWGAYAHARQPISPPVGSDLTVTEFAVPNYPASANQPHVCAAVLEYPDASGVLHHSLLGNFTLTSSPRPVQIGQYVAVGGRLGALLDHQSRVSAVDATQPAFDGFDLPNPWVPPFNAALIGGSASDSSVATYLSLAQSASTDAAAAVQTALNNLQQQQTDLGSQLAAAAKSSLSTQQAADSLCGQGNAGCDTNLLHTTVPSNFYQVPNPPGQCTTSDTTCNLNALAYATISTLANGQFDIAEEVYKALTQSSPSFGAYSGGSLQSAFIEQWRALMAPQEKIRAIDTTVSAAATQVDAANAVFQGQLAQQSWDCSGEAMFDATNAGISYGVSAGFPSGVSLSVTFNEGPLSAQRAKCRQETNAQTGQKFQALQALQDAFASVSGALVGFSDALAAITQSSANIASLVQEAKQKKTSAVLEATLAQATSVTSSGLYRMYQSTDVVRAQSLLDGARLYALAARRAIEARYVVNLSTMSSPEAFVASPSLWADGIYTYDLNMPAAVGLTVGATSSTTDSNAVSDYVSNLKAFVTGYAVQRPSAVAADELDVVSLPGFQAQGPIAGATGPDYTGWGQWELHCPADPGTGKPATWNPMPAATGQIATVCTLNGLGRQPDEVKLEFALDPWGRLNDSVANPPFSDRFNARWSNAALNVVGTGIKDCTRAVDPTGCYNDGDVVYSLTQQGPSWVTDYSEQWHFLNTPTTTLEGAKALALELWIDPLQDGWSTPYIAAVMRTELSLAPLGGSYVLDFKVAPEVVLGNIQRIQLLVGSTAWVAQQQ